MNAEIGVIRVFADEIKEQGFTRVVLLGMRPEESDPEYGWIVPSSRVVRIGPDREELAVGEEGAPPRRMEVESDDVLVLAGGPPDYGRFGPVLLTRTNY